METNTTGGWRRRGIRGWGSCSSLAALLLGTALGLGTHALSTGTSALAGGGIGAVGALAVACWAGLGNTCTHTLVDERETSVWSVESVEHRTGTGTQTTARLRLATIASLGGAGAGLTGTWALADARVGAVRARAVHHDVDDGRETVWCGWGAKNAALSPSEGARSQC